MADVRDTKIKQALQGGEDIPNDPSELREKAAAENVAPVTSESSIYRGEDATKIGASVPIHSEYMEENAAEIAAPTPVKRGREDGEVRDKVAGGTGTGIGTLAIALSILSLFVMPILFGAAGIVLGFVARRQGATGLGAWAIGLGAVSIVIGIFILPFF